jgi:hypothetical protein
METATTTGQATLRLLLDLERTIRTVLVQGVVNSPSELDDMRALAPTVRQLGFTGLADHLDQLGAGMASAAAIARCTAIRNQARSLRLGLMACEAPGVGQPVAPARVRPALLMPFGCVAGPTGPLWACVPLVNDLGFADEEGDALVYVAPPTDAQGAPLALPEFYRAVLVGPAAWDGALRLTGTRVITDDAARIPCWRLASARLEAPSSLRSRYGTSSQNRDRFLRRVAYGGDLVGALFACGGGYIAVRPIQQLRDEELVWPSDATRAGFAAVKHHGHEAVVYEHGNVVTPLGVLARTGNGVALVHLTGTSTTMAASSR